MDGEMAQIKKKSDETCVIKKRSNIRDRFGINQLLEQKQSITSLALAKRKKNCLACTRCVGIWL